MRGNERGVTAKPQSGRPRQGGGKLQQETEQNSFALFNTHTHTQSRTHTVPGGGETTTEADLSDRSTPQFSTTPTRFSEPSVEHDTATVYIGLGKWAKANHGTPPTKQCRNHRQLGIYLRGVVNEGKQKNASATTGRRSICSFRTRLSRFPQQCRDGGYTGGAWQGE